jgi:hypothetical protein
LGDMASFGRFNDSSSASVANRIGLTSADLLPRFKG